MTRRSLLLSFAFFPGLLSSPKRLLSQDPVTTHYSAHNIEISSSQSAKKITFTISAPDPLFVTIYADRDQNGKLDNLVDVGYGTLANDHICAFYLYSEQDSSGCGQFDSSAKMSKVEHALGRKQYTLTIQKKELSYIPSSAKVYFQFWNSASKFRTCFPTKCGFSDVVAIPFTP